MGKIVVSALLALSCASLAYAAEPVPATATAGAATDAADYKPRTEHDNTPWRFNMEQGGKRMTADQFDAWMKSKGVRVAKGTGSPAPADAVAAPAVASATDVAVAETQTAK